MKPQTFMNRSGQAVASLARYFKIKPAQMLVMHDELDLPAGTNRLKQAGGHGGHNGLRDIISHLGANDFLPNSHRYRPSRRQQTGDQLCAAQAFEC